MTKNPLFRILAGGILLLSLAFAVIACSPAAEETVEAPDDTSVAPSNTSVAPAGPAVGNGVGDLAPDFSLSVTDGRMASLTDFKQANQPVVVYFFATW